MSFTELARSHNVVISSSQTQVKNFYAALLTALATGKIVDISGNGVCSPYEQIGSTTVHSQ